MQTKKVWVIEMDLPIIIVMALVFITCGALAGATVMRGVVIMEARLAGCEVQP